LADGWVVSASGPVSIGVVGLGWPGHRHAEAILANPGARLYACADLGDQRREEFVRLYKPERVYVSYDELLNDPGVEAVVIGLPNYLHFPATMSALRAGKHVLCEKPPTLSAAEMRKVRSLADQAGKIYFFGRQSRFDGKTVVAKRMVESGRLGRIYFAKATFIRARGIPVGIGGWFLDRGKAGGGALMDIGIHALDTAWYLMGCPAPTSVTGQVFRNFERFVPERMKYDVEDGAYAFVRFEGGAVLQLEVSWAANLPDDSPTNHLGKRESHNTILYGDRATLRLSPFSLFEDVEGRLVDSRLEAEPGSNFAGQMTNFIQAIREGVPAVNSADQAVHLMEMLEGIYHSSEISREIAIG